MDYLTHIRSDSARFGELLAGSDLSAPVPSCPEWNGSDLLWHLAEVQGFWASVVAERLSDPEPAERTKPERPDDPARLIDLYRRSSERLVDALEGAADDVPVWTWHESDQTVGFVRRRQAHEALVHRVDAEQLAGIETGPIATDMAADGVDEFLTVIVGGIPSWGHFEPDGDSARLHAVDAARRWGVAFGRFTGTSPRSGTSYDLPALSVGLDAAEASAAIDGAAAQLDLWLWGRGPVDGLTLWGETRLVDRLRELAAESGQ